MVKDITIRVVLQYHLVGLCISWNGNLIEIIYIHQPPGLVDSSKLDHAYLLKKYFYGLKQAPRAQYQKLISFFFKWGFHNVVIYNNLFVKILGSNVIIFLVYVDDIVLTINFPILLTAFISQLHSTFSLKDIGALYYLLGIEDSHSSFSLFMS